MKIKWEYIPEDIKSKYNLEYMLHDGYIYVKIKKGMYGLNEAAILAYKKILTYLKPRGYYPIPGTSGRWLNVTRKTVFCLCVDDFGIKYYNKDDLNYFQDSLKDYFDFHLDYEEKITQG